MKKLTQNQPDGLVFLGWYKYILDDRIIFNKNEKIQKG